MKYQNKSHHYTPRDHRDSERASARALGHTGGWGGQDLLEGYLGRGEGIAGAFSKGHSGDRSINQVTTVNSKVVIASPRWQGAQARDVF